MSEWKGLHNPDRHDTTRTKSEGALCMIEAGGCSSWCFPGHMCYCCLESEVAVQTARADSAEMTLKEISDAHRKGRIQLMSYPPKDTCRGCGGVWPCETVRILQKKEKNKND